MFGEQVNPVPFRPRPAPTKRTAFTRVLLVHRSEIVRNGLRQIVGRDPGMDVVGESDSVLATMRAVWLSNPDLIIVEAGLPHGGAVQLVRAGRAMHPGLRWVILGRADQEGARSAASAAAEAEAGGYVSDDTRGDELCEILRRVAAGERAGERGSRVPAVRPSRVHLTTREREVLAFITLGLTNRQIGRELGLAEKTVKNYVSALLSKLQVERRAQAAVYGFWREDGVGMREVAGSDTMPQYHGAPAPGRAGV